MQKNFELAYLYEPGVYGLPIVDLAAQALETGHLDGKVTSGSGREIAYEFGPNFVNIVDHNYPSTRTQPRLQAYMINKQVGFNLRRWLPHIEPVENHPDFFPTQFMEFSLAYFERRGIDINIVRGDWDEGSINCDDFIDAVDAGDRYGEAARKTWTAHALDKLGYQLYWVRPLRYKDQIDGVTAKFRRMS